MAEFISDTILDTALSYISTNGTRLVLCDGLPANYTDATTDSPTGVALGEVDITGVDYTGPVNGDANGRKLTVNAQTGINVDVTGTCINIAIVDVTGTELLAVADVTSQAVSQGGTADTSAFDIEIADPA